MRFATMMVGAVSAVALSGCVLIDQLTKEDDKCGGHEVEDHQYEFIIPFSAVTAGDFYYENDGVTQTLRWSTTFSNVCAEEHVPTTFDIYYDATLPDVDGVGDASPWPLFQYDTTLSRSSGHLAGTISVGLGQWYEPDETAEFTAGIEMHLPANVGPWETLRTQIHQVKIVASYAAPP